MCEVSVIVPVYNVQAYLPACVESVLRQTLTNFEVLLIDDGSTDQSGHLCDQFAARDPRIRVFHQKNRGLGETRDFGIQQAIGEYICFLDSDDDILPTLLEDNVTLAREHQADFVVYGYQNRYVSSNGTLLKNGAISLPGLSGVYTYDAFWANFAEAKYATAAWVRIYRRDFILENHLRFAVRLNEDAYFLSQVLDTPFRCAVFHPKLYYHYNIRPSSLMTSFQPAFLERAWNERRAFFDAVVRRHAPMPGLYEPLLAKEAVLDALEVGKKLSFASQTLSTAERAQWMKQFCGIPRIASGLRSCDLRLLGSRWQRTGAQILQHGQYLQAVRFFDFLQTIRHVRDTVYRLHLPQN